MRTIFVGDVHGCAAELAALLAKVSYDGARDRLLLTGDAFSRGPDPLAVWQLIGRTEAEMVLGNHDARLLKQLTALAKGRRPKVKYPDQDYTLAQLQPVHDTIRAWLRQRPLYIAEDAFLLVHAGIHPRKGLQGTHRSEFLNIRGWPPTRDPASPRWHDFYAPEYPVTVFGHDAPGGLVVKKCAGRPYLVGLDSGCIYGGQLSGYVLKEARIVQVESQQEAAGLGEVAAPEHLDEGGRG